MERVLEEGGDTWLEWPKSFVREAWGWVPGDGKEVASR